MVIIIYTISTRIKQVLQVIQIRRLGNLLQLLRTWTNKRKSACIIWIKIMIKIVPKKVS